MTMFVRRVAALVLASIVVSGADCSGTSVDPRGVGDGRRVLFIGNSLTYYNDLPGIVQTLADSAGGERLVVAEVTGPDMALVDHWQIGEAQLEIARGWDVVVLQQGPSSVEINRDSLRMFTARFAAEIARVGGRPALYSVWPTRSRPQDFARAIESYELAAADVNGLLFPVAEAWLAAWQRDAMIELYAPDGLHPSVAGSYLAALVMYARLLGETPVGLPATLRLRSGATIAIDPALAAILQQAAAEATAGTP
jgi:hypothetical protein